MTLRLRAGTWFNLKDYDQAIADYSAVIKLTPKSSAAYGARGRMWMFKNEFEKAVADFSEMIQLGPKSASAYNSRGGAYRLQGEIEKADADFQEAARLGPKTSNEYDNRGSYWHKKGEYAKAVDDFTESIRLSPDYPLPYAHLSWILATCPDAKLRDGKLAVEMAKKGYELYRGLNDFEGARPLYITALAAAYAEVGNFDAAVRLQSEAVGLLSIKNKNFRRDHAALKCYQSKKAFREEQPPGDP